MYRAGSPVERLTRWMSEKARAPGISWPLHVGIGFQPVHSILRRQVGNLAYGIADGPQQVGGKHEGCGRNRVQAKARQQITGADRLDRVEPAARPGEQAHEDLWRYAGGAER